MSDRHIEFVGSIPEYYDRYLGPLFFDHSARDLAGRIEINPSGRVLETACGTGIATQALRRALPETVEIVATDLNPPMLEFARGKRGGLRNVRFEYADAAALPYAAASFDAALCQFGVMFFPDREKAFRETHRVLKPGGPLVFSVWDALDQNPIPRLAHEVVSTFFQDEPPTFLLTPFGCHRVEPLVAALERAGFGEIHSEAVATERELPSARDVALGLVHGNPGILEIRERAAAAPSAVVDALAERLRAEFGDDPLRAPLRATVLTARRGA